MSMLNALELSKKWAPHGSRAIRFREVYPFVVMLRGCFINPDYRPSPELAGAFALTSSGEEMLHHVKTALPAIDHDSCRLGVAVYFSQDALLVDVEATDPRDLMAALAVEMKDGRIRFFQESGRILYDRFFDLFPSRTTQLTYDETLKLFAGAPPAAITSAT